MGMTGSTLSQPLVRTNESGDAEWMKDAPPHLKTGKGEETKKNMPTVGTKKMSEPNDAEWMKDAPPHLKAGEGEEPKKNMPTVNTKKAEG